ncbi:MAG: UDP-2,3-diacylglucosamine diphosphatase [Lysobacterales bacterium]
MPTLFISDLHLDDRRPETTALLLKFLQEEAIHADALYILGDLFEFWLGDDVPSKCAVEVATALKHLGRNGVPCYFMHGNRDFLLQDNYAALAGLQLLPEEHVVDLYGERVLLMHGDSLCTDDVAYQQFRNVVRDPAWQQDFLAKSAPERRQTALQARDASAAHKGNLDMNIMDVNPAEVKAAFERHGVLRMIHGHTHRPATHDLEIQGQNARRIVLGDWYTQGSVLRVHAGHYDLSVLPHSA